MLKIENEATPLIVLRLLLYCCTYCIGKESIHGAFEYLFSMG